MIFEAELHVPLPLSFAAGCGGGGMLGRGFGFGAGLEGRGRDPEWKSGGVSGGVGLLGGECSDSPWACWGVGGCGGGWLGAWIRASLLWTRRGVMGGCCGEPGAWVLLS